MKLAPVESRRRFLHFILSSTTLGYMTGCDYILPVETSVITNQLASYLRYSNEAAELGRFYLLRTNGATKVSVEQMTERILASLGLTLTNMTQHKLSKLAEILKNQVRLDFSEEKLIVVDGWLLSETEAMLCALVSLIK